MLPENTAALWSALTIECNLYKCPRVLLEGRFISQKMSCLTAYASATQAMNIIQGLRVACCFENYTEDDSCSFFKTVASNRGVEIDFFNDRQKAFRWLGVKDQKGARASMTGILT